MKMKRKAHKGNERNLGYWYVVPICNAPEYNLSNQEHNLW